MRFEDARVGVKRLRGATRSTVSSHRSAARFLPLVTTPPGGFSIGSPGGFSDGGGMRGRFFGVFEGGAASEPSPGGGMLPHGGGNFDVSARAGVGIAQTDPVARRLPAHSAALYTRILGEAADRTAAANALVERRRAVKDGRTIAAANLDAARATRNQTPEHTLAHLEAELRAYDAELA